METLEKAEVTVEAGLIGCAKGVKFPLRQITILQRELWEEALGALGNPDLPWTARRANLLVEDVDLPRGAGSEIAVGPVRLEVTAQTTPCALMDAGFPGLRLALAPGWRGGITARVLGGGSIALGDPVSVLRDIPLRKVYLPG